MTPRAKKRLLLLFCTLATIVVGLGIVAKLRANSRQALSKEMGESGTLAYQEGRWSDAVEQLERAVAGDNANYEWLAMLAEAKFYTPELNNKHLRRAISLSTVAYNEGLRQQAPQQFLIDVLELRLQCMAKLGSPIVQVTEECDRILDIDPGNEIALRFLLGVAVTEGRLLPAESDDLVANGRSVEDWHESLRKDGDTSALRWVLESNLTQSDLFREIEKTLEVLELSDWENAQLQVLGKQVESLSDVVRAIAALNPEMGPATESYYLAIVAMAAGDVQEGRALLSAAEAIAGDSIRLRVKIIETLALIGGEAEQIDRNILAIEDLLKTQESIASVGSFLYLLWEDRREGERLGLWLDRIIAASEVDEESLLAAAIVSGLAYQEKLAPILMRLEASSVRDRSLARLSFFDDPQVREILKAVENKELSSGDLTLSLTGDIGPTQNPYLLALTADLVRRVDATGVATALYEQAARATGFRSIQIVTRLLNILTQSEDSISRFRVAAQFAAARQYDVPSVIALCNAWANLEMQGFDARAVDPAFTEWDSPLALATLVDDIAKSDGPVRSVFAPTFIRIAALAGETDLATARANAELQNASTFQTAFQLARVIRDFRLPVEEDPLVYLRRLADSESDYDRIVVLESQELRSNNAEEDADLLLLERFRGRDDEYARRQVASAISSRAARNGTPLELEVIGDSRERFSFEIASTLMRSAVSAGDAEAARQIISDAEQSLASSQSGELDQRLVFLVAMYSVGFEADDQTSLDRTILQLDRYVTLGVGLLAFRDLLIEAIFKSKRISDAANEEFVYAARLRDLLYEAVAARPGRFREPLVLAELLQQNGEFEDAAAILNQLANRASVAPRQVRRSIIRLLIAQGEYLDASEIACDLADETGFAQDQVKCLECLEQSGQFAKMEEKIEAVARMEDADPAILLAISNSLATMGRFEDAVRFAGKVNRLEDVTAFKVFEANLEFKAGRPERARSILRDLGVAAEKSAKAQLLLARLSLSGPSPDTSAGDDALRRAVELEPDSGEVALANVIIRAPIPAFRDSFGDAIQHLRSIGTKASDIQADLFEIVLRQNDGTRSQESLAEDLRAIRKMLQANPRLEVAWTQGLNLLSRQLQDAYMGGTALEISDAQSALREFALEYVAFFPRALVPLEKQVEALVLTGDFALALSASNRMLELVTGPEQLGIRVLRSRLMSDLGDYQGIAAELAPFAEAIASDPGRVPFSWDLLLHARLATGEIEAATGLMEASGRDLSLLESWSNWLAMFRYMRPADVVECVELMEAVLPKEVNRIQLISAVISAFAENRDPDLGAAIERLLAEADAVDATRLREINLAMLRMEFEIARNRASGLASCEALLLKFSGQEIRNLANFEKLPVEEQRRIEMLRTPITLIVNNFMSRISDDLLQGRLEPAEFNRMASFIEAFDAILVLNAGNSAEVLDTRSRFKLALGDPKSARDLVERAIQLDPTRAAFRLLLARILAEESDVLGAQDACECAIYLGRLGGFSNADLISEATAFLDQLNG